MTTAQSRIATGSYGTNGALALWDATEAGPWRKVASAEVPAPSFVCWHPTLPLLYAASELENGTVSAWRIVEDSLVPAGSVSSGGSAPCWLATDSAGTWLVAANYGSEFGGAALAVIPLGDDGSLPAAPIVIPGSGSGPVVDRQAASHVHQALPTPVGTVLVCDLGADVVMEYSVADGSVTELSRLAMPAGSGPRHVALTADGYTGFVAGELDGSVTEIRRDSSSGWHVGARVMPCTTDRRVPDEVPDNELYPSHIELVHGDRWLLVANRGVGTLAVLDVADELRVVSEAAVADWPRHFAVVYGLRAAGGQQPADGLRVADGLRAATVLVAAQHGGVVQSLSLDLANGALTVIETVAAIATASCVAPEPSR